MISAPHDQRTYANPDVLRFYRQLPFNYADSPSAVAAQIREYNHALAYPPLGALATPNRRVLDVGCGAGWLVNSIAYHFKSDTTGIDFNPVAIDFARAVSAELGTPTTFQQADLFLYRPERLFDVVTSIGVLHHTDDCHAALRHLFARLVRPGGHALIGLYHAHGRKPFLDHFAQLRGSGATEAQQLAEFRRLFGDQGLDETHVVSWFRDQVLHPHETQHTLHELLPLIESCGMELLTTSFDEFKPISSLRRTLEAEITYGETGARKLQEGRYFSGFFVFLVRRKSR